MIDLDDMKRLNGGKKPGVQVVCEPCVRTTPVIEPPFVPIRRHITEDYRDGDDYYRHVFDDIASNIRSDFRQVQTPLTTANTINRRNEK